MSAFDVGVDVESTVGDNVVNSDAGKAVGSDVSNVGYKVGESISGKAVGSGVEETHQPELLHCNPLQQKSPTRHEPPSRMQRQRPFLQRLEQQKGSSPSLKH